MTQWRDMVSERDEKGELTDLALALSRIGGEGCDCGTGEDEPECTVCLCENALRGQWEEINILRSRVAELERNLAASEHACSVLDKAVFEKGMANGELIAKASKCERAAHTLAHVLGTYSQRIADGKDIKDTLRTEEAWLRMALGE